MPDREVPTLAGMVDEIAEHYGDSLLIIHEGIPYMNAEAVTLVAENLLQAAVVLQVFGENTGARAYAGVAQVLAGLIKAGAEDAIFNEIVKAIDERDAGGFDFGKITEG